MRWARIHCCPAADSVLPETDRTSTRIGGSNMGIMADRLNRMEVRVSSPDRWIEATLTNQDQVSVRFGYDAYRLYDERTLEQQLGRLATRVWVEYRREYYRALSDATGEIVRGDEYEPDGQRRLFQQAQAAMISTGVSAGGWIKAEAEGLVRWQVTIRDGATRKLTEEQFVQEVQSVVAALLSNYYAKMVALKDGFYDLRLPN